MAKIKLIEPKFNQELTLPLGFSIKAFIFGPFLLLTEKRFLSFIIAIVITFMTLGFFWIYYAFNYNRVKIHTMISKGYKVNSQEESLISKYKLNINTEQQRILISRLGSVDHLL